MPQREEDRHAPRLQAEVMLEVQELDLDRGAIERDGRADDAGDDP